MGMYNGRKDIGKILLDNKCPFCNGDVKPDTGYPDMDSYDFTCSSCNPKAVICLSGGLAINVYLITDAHPAKKEWAISKIKAATKKLVPFLEDDFR